MEKVVFILTRRPVVMILPGLLLFLAWPPLGLGIPVFFALVPLLLYPLVHDRKRYFYVLYLALFVFNLSTTWWVKNASMGGAIFMLLANTLLMCLPFLAYRFTLNSFGISKSLMAFVFYWLAFEYFHFNWDISFPWLTLGNVFAMKPEWVQWYEITGVLGGSLWILLVNVGLVLLLKSPSRKRWIYTAILLIVPFSASLLRYYTYTEPLAPDVRVAIIQPNINPYEKFVGGSEVDQVRKFIDLANAKSGESPQLFILPETAVVEYLNEDDARAYESVVLLERWLGKREAHLLTGASTYHFYEPDQKPTITARKAANGSYYDSYNTALLMNATGPLEWYHKSRLVPGVEQMPYPGFFKFLEPFAIDMGGITGSLGKSREPVVMKVSDSFRVAPLICYESVYGDYVAAFSRKGANLLAVITNDGWWGNTPGYRQHLHYARLRAIENRKYVVRSANTGISAVINSKGDILQHTEWWQPDVINADVKLLQNNTYYVQYGDYLGRFALFLGVFFFLGVWVKKKVKY